MQMCPLITEVTKDSLPLATDTTVTGVRGSQTGGQSDPGQEQKVRRG